MKRLQLLILVVAAVTALHAAAHGNDRFAAADAVGGAIRMQVADTSVPPKGMAADGNAMTDGEIRKVDKEAGKITIRHGEIRNLDMPAMTMVFRVKDPAMLDRVKPGDRVRFHAEDVAGVLVVTALVPAT